MGLDIVERKKIERQDVLEEDEETIQGLIDEINNDNGEIVKKFCGF